MQEISGKRSLKTLEELSGRMSPFLGELIRHKDVDKANVLNDAWEKKKAELEAKEESA